MNTEYLNRELARIDERLHFEKLLAIVPAAKAMHDQNRIIVQMLHRLACVFQKHQMSILTDPETGLTYYGHDPEQAQAECIEAIAAVRELAVRYQ